MKNVLVVCGGESYEHDISVITAAQIFSKTKLDNVNLMFFYVSRQNKYYIYTDKKIDLKDFSLSKFSSGNKKFKEVVFVSSEKNKIFVKSIFGLKEYANVSSAIICTHGGNGENGKLVSFLEDMGIMTTSGKFDALAVCMNKYLFKQVMRGLKIPTVSGFKLKKGEFENNKKSTKVKLGILKYPVVIKPVNGGSSIGLFVAYNEEDFVVKINDAFMFDDEILVERFIENSREFNVAVLGNGVYEKVSEVDEPLKDEEVLTFADKYLKNNGNKKLADKGSMANQERRLPAEIDNVLKNKIQGLAKKIFSSLNLCGVVRIDFLYDDKSNKLYVCEVNAVPGSLAYYFYSKSGYLINDFTSELIKIAELKLEQKVKIKSEFMPSILD